MDLDFGVDDINQSVMRELGLSELIYKLLRASSIRECPCCHAIVKLYNDPHEVAACIKEAVQGAAVTILLSGGKATKEWALSEGFSEASQEKLSDLNFSGHQLPSDHSVFILDISEKQSTTWLSIVRFLPTLLRISGASVHISRAGVLSSYSRYGTCATCLQSGAPIPAQLPPDSAMMSELFDGRCIGHTSYSKFIASEITPDVVNGIPHSPLRTALRAVVRLSGLPISLKAQVRRYPKSQIVLTRKVITLTKYQGDAPLVLHAPNSWLSLSDSVQLRALLEERARDFPILALRTTRKAESIYDEPTPKLAPMLATTHASSIANQVSKIIDVTPAPKSEDILLYEWLEIAPLLFRRFSSSVLAKMEGITEKDFKRLTNRKPNIHTCPHCKGTGLLAVQSDRTEKETSSRVLLRCSHCNGRRYDDRIGKVTVKGLSLAGYLDQSFNETYPFLRTLPTLVATIDILRDLALDHLPLGLPTNLLGPSERLMLGFVKALATLPQPDTRTMTIPEVTITAELPAATLSPGQRIALAQVLRMRRNTHTHIRLEITTDAPEFRGL
jgi:hypothetical protein